MPPVAPASAASFLHRALRTWFGPDIADRVAPPTAAPPSLPTALPALTPPPPPPPPSWGAVKRGAVRRAVLAPYQQAAAQVSELLALPSQAAGEAIQTGDLAGAPVRTLVKSAIGAPPPAPSQALRARGVDVTALMPEGWPEPLRRGLADLGVDVATDPLNALSGAGLGMAAVGGIGRGRGLYSRLDDALQAWPVNKPVPVNSLLNYLKGRTSQDEVAYRLFPALQGRQTITKAEALDAIAARPIAPQVTRYGKPGPLGSGELYAGEEGKWNPGKYPQYNLEGGVPGTYSETVQALPPKQIPRSPAEAFDAYVAQLLQKYGDEYAGRTDWDWVTPAERQEVDRLWRAGRDQAVLWTNPEVTPPFTSHAFPQKDIVGWTRGQDYRLGTLDPRAAQLQKAAEDTRHLAQRAALARMDFLNTHPNIPLDQLMRDPEYGRLVQEENTFDRLAQETWTEYANYGKTPEQRQQIAALEARIAQAEARLADRGLPSAAREAARDAREMAAYDLDRLRQPQTHEGPLGRLVEEGQSDLHQKGRDEGYATPEATAAWRAKRDALEADVQAAYRNFLDVERRYGMTRAQAIQYHNEAALNTPGRGLVPPRPDGRPRTAVEEAWIISHDLGQAEDRYVAANRAYETHPPPPHIPDLPYKDPGWQDLGLKQELLDAAKRPEIEWIGFPGGDEQARRYSAALQKEVSRLEYDPERRVLTAHLTGGRGIREIPKIGPDQIATYVGKDSAQKLLAQSRQPRQDLIAVMKDDEGPWYSLYDGRGRMEGHRYLTRADARAAADALEQGDRGAPYVLEGEDLTVGGEGMRVQYDQKYRSRLEKLLKPFGVPVESMQVGPRGVLIWFARLSPAVKSQILEKGFPLLALLAMLQETTAPGQPPPVPASAAQPGPPGGTSGGGQAPATPPRR